MHTSVIRASLPCMLGLTSWCSQPVTAATGAESPVNNRDIGRIVMFSRSRNTTTTYLSGPASTSDWNELQWAAMLSSAAYAGCTGRTHDVNITHQIANKATATQVYFQAPKPKLPSLTVNTGFHRHQQSTQKNRHSLPRLKRSNRLSK